jgi:ATP-binding cassette subfamily F protein 3
VDSPFNFTFSIPEKLPNPLLTLDSAVIGYKNSMPILPHVTLNIAAGDRIRLLGQMVQENPVYSKHSQGRCLCCKGSA